MEDMIRDVENMAAARAHGGQAAVVEYLASGASPFGPLIPDNVVGPTDEIEHLRRRDAPVRDEDGNGSQFSGSSPLAAGAPDSTSTPPTTSVAVGAPNNSSSVTSPPLSPGDPLFD